MAVRFVTLFLKSSFVELLQAETEISICYFIIDIILYHDHVTCTQSTPGETS